tara:strand:- start:26 stop:223 length:198 start_codon:yes stop_codon:yes gene_type:complete
MTIESPVELAFRAYNAAMLADRFGFVKTAEALFELAADASGDLVENVRIDPAPSDALPDITQFPD